MTQPAESPAHNRYSGFRCEEGTVTDVNRNTYTVTVETRHSSKVVEHLQALSPYHHFKNGEGYHHLPEVGAVCMLGWPSDNTPPVIMGYKGMPSATGVPEGEEAAAPTSDGEGSPQDVSFRSRRLALQPGDLAMTTRDENFLVLRRGGIVQLGATPVAQRVYIPILNYIKDFCENYEMHAFGGDVSWRVERQEDDPSGDAPATYIFHCNTYAQDEMATVRVRHMTLAEAGGGDRVAWEVQIAPQHIDRDTGVVTDAVYTLEVTVAGDMTVTMASRTVTVEGDDTLTVQGGRSITVSGDDVITSQSNMRHTASGEAVFGGATVKLVSRAAGSPAVKGDALLIWLSGAQWVVNTGTGTAVVSPASILQLQQILSRKVFLE